MTARRSIFIGRPTDRITLADRTRMADAVSRAIISLPSADASALYLSAMHFQSQIPTSTTVEASQSPEYEGLSDLGSAKLRGAPRGFPE